MNVDLLSVPYDSGVRGWRMGAGPERLLDGGLATHLRSVGMDVRVHSIEAAAPDRSTEIGTAFELNRLLSERVRASLQQDRLPLVLAGNCVTAVGTLAGLAAMRPAVLWLDAHGDANTPDTTRSGFLDGMALAITTGWCWRALARTVPGFVPVPERRVLHVGGRDLDDGERELLARSDCTVLPPGRVGAELGPALERLRTLAADLYVHIDLDVLDPSEGRANAYAVSDGLTTADAARVLGEVARAFRVRAVTVSAYDPAGDEGGRIPTATRLLLDAVLPEGR